MTFAAAHAASPFDQPIGRLDLRDGRTLTHVQIVGFASSAIMAKWDGGRGTISYQSLPPDLLRAAQRYRPAASAPTPRPDLAKHGGTAATLVSASLDGTSTEARTLNGRIYIATDGGEKRLLSNVAVYAFPLDLVSRFETAGRVRLPAPLATATTDEDGNFSLNLSADARVFVYAHARREVALQSGATTESFTWAVAEPSAEENGGLILSNRNLQPGDPRVTIDGAMVGD